MQSSEINLIDYWRVIAGAKKMISLIIGVTTLASVIVSLLMTSLYRAEATLLPLGKSSGVGEGGTLLAHMAATAVQSGLGGFSGAGDAVSSRLKIILTSRTLAKRVITKFDLMKDLYPREEVSPPLDDVAEGLSKSILVEKNVETSLISVSSISEIPELSTKIVNCYLQELADYINENALTTAKRNRIFIQGQLERNKEELLNSGKELASFYATNKISNVVPTVDVSLTPEPSPTSSREQSSGGGEIEKKMERLEEQIEKTKMVKDVPQQVYLQYLIVRRELLGQMNLLLAQQHEMAKIQESKEDLNFQIIDWARVPKIRFKPARRQIVVLSFVSSLFFGVLCAFFREYWRKMEDRVRPRENR